MPDFLQFLLPYLDLLRFLTPFIHVFVFSALLAALFTLESVIWARRWGVVAHPSHRSSHTQPTPRLGGLGFLAAMASIFFVLHLVSSHRTGTRILQFDPWFLALVLGGAWAFAGGLLDDLMELPPSWKLLFQIAAAATALAVGFEPDILRHPDIRLWFADTPLEQFLGIADVLIVFAAIVFFMNAFNFMDGMDGQAAGFALVVLLVVCYATLPARFQPSAGIALAAAIAAGAQTGFLGLNGPWNRTRFKCFMGDCGSQFLGFALAVFVLQAAAYPRNNFGPPAALLLLAPFWFDVIYTLVRRLVRGENILVAHRTHLYQRLLVAGYSHGSVLMLNSAVWVGCALLALTYSGADGPLRTLTMCSVAGLLALYALFVLRVERAARRT